MDRMKRMTLNPGAAAFVPSVETLRLAKKSPALCVSVEEGEDIKKINFTPKIQTNNFVETYGYHQFVEDDLVLDYSNFDLPFFFHDMMFADSEDFENNLLERAMYLIGYARTSPAYAIEVIDRIAEFSVSKCEGDISRPERAAKLVVEMSRLDPPFFQRTLQRLTVDMNRSLDKYFQILKENQFKRNNNF